MNNTTLLYSTFLLLSTFIGSCSQVMLKKASAKKYENVFKEYLNPLVILAYILFFGTTLLAILAYKVVPISLGPVLETTSYIYITFFGIVIFKEKFTKRQFFSLFLIISGILIYSLLPF